MKINKKKTTTNKLSAVKMTSVLIAVGFVVLLASGRAPDVAQLVILAFQGTTEQDNYNSSNNETGSEAVYIINPQPESPHVSQDNGEQEAETETEPDAQELTQEPEPIPAPYELFFAYSLPDTDPSSFGSLSFSNRIIEPLYPIHFGMPESYSEIGITTFRGNNFRNSASWGTAEVEQSRLVIRYQQGVGSMEGRNAITCAQANCEVAQCEGGHFSTIRWEGVGWPGQPVIVNWDYQMQQIMNINPQMRNSEGLVEVIQNALDGYIYFFELETGRQTRSPIFLGEPIKAGVTIDPRGYPLMFVGQGDELRGSRFGFYIFSLIDGTELFYLNGRDEFSVRWWGAFDANPLIDSENDRLIAAGENGVIYSMQLNTQFDANEGTISIDPVISRYRHTGSRRLGTENSPAAFSHYMFFADNSGIITCLDLITMEPVWVFAAGDDTDASIVLDWEAEHERLALYTGTQVDLQGSGGHAFIRKLDAANGQVLWEHAIPCHFNSSFNGGVLATPVVGQHDISELVIFWVAQVVGRGGGGALIAYDKESGEIVWERILPSFGWSSPNVVYTDDGRSYLIVGDSVGDLRLIRGTTGEVLYRISLGGNIEASPAVYGNYLVVGTRGQRIFGIEIL